MNTLDQCWKVSDLFQKYTSITVQRSDCFPKYICTECFRKIENFHEFSSKCTASNVKLMEKKVSIKKEMAVSKKYNSKQAHVKGLSFDEIFLKGEQSDGEQLAMDTESDAFQTDEDSDFNEDDYKSEKSVFRPNSWKPKFKCDFCRASFHLKVQYDAHLREHAGLKPYPCTKCHKAFSKLPALREHMLGHMMDNDKIPRFICEPCGRSFFFKVSLEMKKKTFTSTQFINNYHFLHSFSTA